MAGATRAVRALPFAPSNGAVLTLGEVASTLKCCPEQARLMALAGQIPGAFRVGKLHRVSAEPFFRWLSTVGETA
jgi:hypothetical protein